MVPRTPFEDYFIFYFLQSKVPKFIVFFEHYRWGNVLVS